MSGFTAIDLGYVALQRIKLSDLTTDHRIVVMSSNSINDRRNTEQDATNATERPQHFKSKLHRFSG